MEKKEAIQQFALQRPQSKAIYGYGSGVFKQDSNSSSKPLTDVIFIVDDIKKWHHDNMELNPKDYSIIGRVHLSRKNISKLKGRNNITYFSEITEGEYTFKYGVIEVGDFVRSLNTWDNLFMVGRFHKPVMEIDSQDNVRESIVYNRNCALMIACLFSKHLVTKKELFNTLCGLSYIGDARMAIAENPNKVANIVDGSFDKISEIYLLEESYLKPLINDMYAVNHEELLMRLHELPVSLLEYFNERAIDTSNLCEVREAIWDYIKGRNQVESKAQIIQGIKTNGVIRSVPYALAKVKKRFSK